MTMQIQFGSFTFLNFIIIFYFIFYLRKMTYANTIWQVYFLNFLLFYYYFLFLFKKNKL